MDNKLTWIFKYNREHNGEYENFVISGKYLAIRMPSHHKARTDGYVYIHQLEAEKKLGRKLRDGECVHHIDENKFNNDWDNLMVFKTLADHTAFHNGAEIDREGDVWAAFFKGTKISIGSLERKDVRRNVCPICGTNFKNCSAKMCASCYLKDRRTHIPPKETLTDLILNSPMLRIGEMYGVSDNAVRKWFKKYNLPSSRKGILDFKNGMNFKASV